MDAIRKIIKVKHSSISFNELAKYNNQDVEVIIFPLSEYHDYKNSKKNILKYSGIIKSDHYDTSENIDTLIYGE